MRAALLTLLAAGPAHAAILDAAIQVDLGLSATAPASVTTTDLGDLDGDGLSEVATAVAGGDAAWGAVAVRWSWAPRGVQAPDLTLVGGPAFGTALAAGDFDGDGHRDLAVLEPGVGVHVWSGPFVSNSASELVVLAPNAGGHLVGVPDLDHDGDDELVLGLTDPACPLRLIPGLSGHRGDVLLRALPGGRLHGMAPEADLAIGDLNGDGAADLVTGLPGGDLVVVTDLLGGLAGHTVHLETAGALIPEADLFGPHLGAAIALADVDGDGADDLLAGAPDGRGAAMLVTGWTDWEPGTVLDGRAAVTRLLPAPGEHLGGRTLTLADLTGDGRAEVVLGASDGLGRDERVYLLLATAAARPGGQVRLDPRVHRHVGTGAAWATLDVGTARGLSRVADLDGDGADELAASLRHGAAWWLAILLGP